MVIDVITIFPEVFDKFTGSSIIGRAQGKGLVKINIHNLRDYTLDKHKKVDDKPFGGGPGMVLMVEPIARAMAFLKKRSRKKPYNILLSPRGRRFSQQAAQELALKERLVLLCGHYEGFDERVKEIADFNEVSVGDYVTSGGEAPAMVIIDAIVRLVPGVLGNEQSLKEESFTDGRTLEYPQYTRPREYKRLKVPEVLVSGNHKEIDKWRKSHSKEYKS